MFFRRRKSPVRFRITLAGWLFLLVMVLIGIVTSRNSDPMVHWIFGAAIGAFVASILVGRRIISGVELQRDVPIRTWQNQTVHFGYHLRNTHYRQPCLGLEIHELAPRGIQSAAGYCVHLPARTVFRAGARMVVRRRGRIELSGVRLSTRLPFGLITAYRDMEMPASLVVWPARGQLRRQLLHRGAALATVTAPSQITGGQDEFFGLRDYRGDDNPRWIHWRRSAGRQTPVVKEMSRPRPEILWVVLDTLLSDHSEVTHATREQMLRFAGTLIDYAFRRQYKVGLALALKDEPVAYLPAAGRGQRQLLLDALSEVDADTTVRFDRTVAALRRTWLTNAQVVVMSPSARQLDAVDFSSLRTACLHLDAFSDKQFASVFEDNPYAHEGGAVCR